MKITITLSDAEVKGIKTYLKSVSHDINPKITKAEIVDEIRGIVNGEIYNAAMGDYVSREVVKDRILNEI
jgi:hypothetical protein